MRTVALITAGLVVATLTFGCAAAHAQVPDEYEVSIRRALQDFDRGRWAEARALFQHASSLYPNARVLRGIGMTSFELRDYVAAIEALEEALQHESEPLSPRQRRQVDDLLQRSLTYVCRISFVLEPRNAVLLVDGAVPVRRDGVVLLNDGEHELHVSAAGHVPVTLRREFVTGEQAPVLIELPRAPRAGSDAAEVANSGTTAPANTGSGDPSEATPTVAPEESPSETDETGDPRRGLRLAGLSTLGAGGAAGLVAITTGIVAHQQQQDLEADCGGPCPASRQGDVDRGERFARASTALTFVALAGIGAGLTMTLLSRSGDHHSDERDDTEDAGDQREPDGAVIVPTGFVSRQGAQFGAMVMF